MLFLNPSAWYWAILAIPIVALFLLKMRTRRVSVGSVMFWQQVAEEKPPRALWLRIRHLASLLVQLALLLLLVTGLSQPVWESLAETPGRIVVVLDTSASMQAGENGETRFEMAVASVHSLIESLNGRDRMAIVSASQPAHVVCGLTSHVGTLRQALTEMTCTDCPTALPDAVGIAERLLGSASDSEIRVITDGCGDLGSVDANLVSVERHGNSAENLAITMLQVRRSVQDPLTWQVLTRVNSFRNSAASGTLDLFLDGEILDVLNVDIEANGTWSQVAEFRSSAGGVVSAELRPVDALQLDNRASTMLAERTPVSVTLVTQGQWFLEQVLAANALVDLTVADRVPEILPPGGILVVHGKVPTTIPTGNVIVVHPVNATSLWGMDGRVEAPLVGTQQDDELTENVSLENILMPTVENLVPRGEHDVLIESAVGVPLLVKYTRESGSLVVLNINVDEGDLPLRTAFPILLGNAVAAMANQSSEIADAISTGRSVGLPASVAGASDSASVVELRSPDGQDLKMIRAGKEFRVPPLKTCGVYRVRSREAASDAGVIPKAVFAANLFDEKESDLRFGSKPAEQAEKRSAMATGHPLWWSLTLSVLILFCCEWCLFHRRWI